MAVKRIKLNVHKKRKKYYIHVLSSYHSDSFQRSYLIQNLLSNTSPIGHIQTHDIYIYTITIQIQNTNVQLLYI